MRHTLSASGALGHTGLKHALKKEGETSDTDEFQRNRHGILTPAERAKRLSPGQVLAPKWPQLQYAAVPKVDVSSFTLQVNRNGQHARAFTFHELLHNRFVTRLPNTDFHCVTGWSILDTTFTVIPLAEFLCLEVGFGPGDLKKAKRIFTYCLDNFTGSLPIEHLHTAALCVGAYGMQLEPKHGFPVRLLIPTLYGFKSAKWVHTIDVIDEDKLGFWELRGYDDSANPWLEERFAGKTGKDGLTAAQRAKHALKEFKR